jgi:tRNA(Ile)-lysidine synthase
MVQPLGLGGHSQKLSDFFVNEKVPARARARWPLLCAGETVVWVPGHRLAEPFKLEPKSREIARFCLKPPASG